MDVVFFMQNDGNLTTGVGATYDKLPQPHSRIYGIAIDQEALAYTQSLSDDD